MRINLPHSISLFSNIRGGKTRALTKEDFSRKIAIFLQPNAQFNYLASLTDSDDRATKNLEVMESIEEEDESFDFEEALHDIHVQLEDLNTEAVRLPATIRKNFREIGI